MRVQRLANLHNDNVTVLHLTAISKILIILRDNKMMYRELQYFVDTYALLRELNPYKNKIKLATITSNETSFFCHLLYIGS